MTDRPITAHPASQPTDTGADQDEADPGSFVGNRPERQTESIPGGVRLDDERVAANGSQATGGPDEAEPAGHRGSDADTRLEAGQDR